MSQILVEFDNTLKKSEIIVPIGTASENNSGEISNDYGETEISKTKVLGILSPLIMINNTVIDFNLVHYFKLSSDGVVPELSMLVEDRNELIKTLDTPKFDNEVRVQILPRFDNAYKKIDLTFYISSININGSFIRMSCIYKVPALYSSKFESFGKIDTYSLFKHIAEDSKMGFASNVKECNDSRFVYADNKSWLTLMNSEIDYSNTTDHVLDYWIDFWNNINIADIKERYEAVDSKDDIQVWIAGSIHDFNEDVKSNPVKVPAILIDHPSFSNSELFVKNFELIFSPGSSIANGTDLVCGIFEENKQEHLDHLLQNGDVKNDIFTKYEYLGECYGDYNYILSKNIRNSFLQKIDNEKIKVTLQTPLLGIMRGHKVNFIHYYNDDKIEYRLNALEEAGIIDRNINSNIPLEEYEITEDASSGGKFKLDRTISAQYLISSVDIIFDDGEWEYILTLIRPFTDKPNIIKE